MIKNYIKIAWRNILKNKVYSFINIIGLALGMAVIIMIGLWILDELSVNNHFANKSKIASIYQSQTFNGRIGTGSAIPLPLEFEMKEKHSDIFKHIIMSSWNSDQILNYEDKNLTIDGYHTSPGIIDMLDIKVVQGSSNGLDDLKSIMISERTAQSFFGNTNPIGSILKLNNTTGLKVTGVFENLPASTSFEDMNYLIPWDYYKTSREWIVDNAGNWDNNSFQMFVQLKEGISMEQADALIKDTKKKAQPENTHNPTLHIHPMEDWHLRNNYENGVKSGGRIENVWLFGIIGIFVLILACINFMNLSTARSEKRSLEVGIRKSIGSTRSQLISQFMSESFLVVLISYVVALIIVFLTLGYFNEIANKSISFPIGNLNFWMVSLVFITITALISGSYPALYLSSFKPITVLKGTFKIGKLAALPRKILVVTQFTVSIALIIGTIVVINQINYSKSRPTGYNNESLIQIPIFSNAFEGRYEFTRNQFLNSGAVIDFASSSSPVTEVWSNTAGYDWEGKPEGFQEDLALTSVSYDYMKTMQMEIIAGRDFSRQFATDSNAVILNETAVKYMNLKDPIGKLILDNADRDQEPPMKIIGVVKDAIIQSPYEPVKQHMYPFDSFENSSYYNLRLNPTQSVSENLSIIERVFKENYPDVPFSYDFVNENFALKYRSEERVASLAQVFAILAVIISCLGLFGLASYVAERRTKEIGVRKVLGASITNLWLLLSKDFLILVAISLIIATPIAYYFMSNWIQKFTYRTEISVMVFIIAGLGAIALTVFTVSFQAIKAANANPVKSLKTE